MFTLPKPLRLVLARDPAWARWVGQLVVRAVGAWQRRVARARGLRAPRTGAVVFCLRFGGLVNLNVHRYHVVIPDGVFVDDGEGLRFEMFLTARGGGSSMHAHRLSYSISTSLVRIWSRAGTCSESR